MTLLLLVNVRQKCQTGEARRTREAAGCSLSEIALECGVSKSTIHNWETCASRPSGDAGVAYAKVLGRLERAVDGSAPPRAATPAAALTERSSHA